MKNTPVRVEVLGVPLDCVNMDQALDFVDEFIAKDKKGTIIAVNPEKIIKANDDENLLKLLNNSSLLIPDGIGAVLGAKLLNNVSLSRVPGAELMPHICQRAVLKKYRIFLLGAAPDVNAKAVEKLKNDYPGVNIVGSRDGYFEDDEIPNLINDINISQANILFIALGSPGQEIWMDKYIEELNVNICQGVGGTFDVLAGNVKRAPAFFRSINLEWLYRLLAQPSRFLRQTALPKYVVLVLKEWLRAKIN